MQTCKNYDALSIFSCTAALKLRQNSVIEEILKLVTEKALLFLCTTKSFIILDVLNLWTLAQLTLLIC